MTKDEALKLALEALEVANSCVDGYYIPKGKTHLPEVEQAITAIKEALEQPEQELTTTLEASIHAGLDKKNDKKTKVDHHGKQPEQEPVVDIDGDEFDAHFRKRINVYADEHPALLVRQLARRLRKEWSTTPPQRKPLTDEHPLMVFAKECVLGAYQETELADAAQRAIKAAHGIKE